MTEQFLGDRIATSDGVKCSKGKLCFALHPSIQSPVDLTFRATKKVGNFYAHTLICIVFQ